MLARARGVVRRVLSERPGAQELEVDVDGQLRRALAYTDLCGHVQPGATVLLNTWAVEMNLGTGGLDFVIASEPTPSEAEPPGHIMKLRYTPVQLPVLAAEAPESPYHEELRKFSTLGAIPVVCAELHSQVPAVAAAAKWETQGEATIVYVMTDGAALAAGLSRLLPEMRSRGLIDAVVTCGQAFGGDFEAINIYSALAVAAVAAKADIIIVGQGPGNTGTGTPLGFSGMDQGIALNAAAALDGTPIAVLRLSYADPRPRHVGLSLHTRTILSCATLSSVLVPVPRLTPQQNSALKKTLELAGIAQRHEIISVNAEPGLDALIDSGIPVTTMGRTVEQERAFFLAAAAAGLVAGQWYSGSRETSAPSRQIRERPRDT